MILPAGALADLVDRRRFLLITQSWMVVAAGVLGVLTLYHQVTPWMLLLFTFILGLGAVMNDPAWQAITPEVVAPGKSCSRGGAEFGGLQCRSRFRPCARRTGDCSSRLRSRIFARRGFIFWCDLFLYRWKRPHFEQVATGTGARRSTGRPALRSRRSAGAIHPDPDGAFSLAASSLPALLPILARPHGATGYGLLLGFFGLGALAGAAICLRVRMRFSVNRLVAFDILLFAAMTFAAGRVQTFSLLCLVLFASGTAWIGILACLNIAAQTMCPSFLRARALSMYLLVLQGGMAVGSTLWGGLATRAESRPLCYVQRRRWS